MNNRLLVTLVLALSPLSSFAADAPSAAPAAPAAKTAAKSPKKAAAAPKTAAGSEEEHIFYAYGYKIGSNLASITSSEVEAKAIARGLVDAILGKSEAFSMAIYLPKLNDLAQSRQAAKSAAIKEKGRAFADEFAKGADVKAIPNGGFIKNITLGTGASPSADDTVKVNYRGTLLDGTEFDSSYKRNEPATFPLKNVIPCWTNGVAMMKIGGKAKLVCPSDVAYGDQGQPRAGIQGGATLVFEIELLDIVKADAPAKSKN